MKKILLLLCILASTAMSAKAMEDNVHFSGALIAEPCIIPDTDTDIHLDFGSIINKALYQYARTPSVAFSIHLTECNTSLANTVNVTFTGTEQQALPGYLSLDSGSTAKGVVIGIESSDGVLIPLNKSSPTYQISDEENALNFNAFVQILPDAARDHSLVEGGFTAISTFVLSYQ